MFPFSFRRRRSPKTYEVSSLDGSTLTFELEGRVTAQELLTRSLEEAQASGEPDHFGLASYEGNFVKWMILNKPLKKQLSGKSPFQLHLKVQVYPLDYHSLSQPTSRHLLALQLRRDLLENRFSCEQDRLVVMLGLAVQADLGDFSAVTCGVGYLNHVGLMPRLTKSLEEQIHAQHQMNRGKPTAACQEELLGVAQMEGAYGIISYQLQDSSRNPVTMTAAPSGVRVLRGMMATNHYHWHTILKISHKGRRLFFSISLQALETGHTHFTCSSSSMSNNMAHHLSRLQASYTSTHTQRPSRLQRFFSSRRSVRVLKPLPHPRAAPSSNPLQRRSLGEPPDPSQLNHASPVQAAEFPRPPRSSLTFPSSPTPLPESTPHTLTTDVELEGQRGSQCHARSDSHGSRYSGAVEGHSRQESGLSHRSQHSALVDPLDLPAHPRQGSVLSQVSHRSSPSHLPQELTVSSEPPASPPSNTTPNHHGNYYNHDTHIHSTPIKAHYSHKEEWKLQSPPATGYNASPSSAHRGSPHSLENGHKGSPYGRDSGHGDPPCNENSRGGSAYGRDSYSHREAPYENGHSSPYKPPQVLTSGAQDSGLPLIEQRRTTGSLNGRAEPSSIPDFIPEEGGGAMQLYPSPRHRHYSSRATPPRQQATPPRQQATPPRQLASLKQPQPQLVPSKSSTFPREGDSSLSQPEGTAADSVVDLLDEALGVLDEEEDQRKEKERQRAQKPWKPQHRGRFRLSLQDSSYYDHRLYSSYRHFNRSRAFHGSKHSSSTTHLNAANDPSVEMVANAQLQESLVELSQTSDTAIDPHIRSFVFESSQTETGGATEL